MNKYLKILYDEHEVIINAIDIAKQARALIEKNENEYEKLIRQLIDFFRKYADQFHHQKEERILFPEMSRRNELLADGVVKEMLDNHEEFREMIGNIEKKLNERDFRSVQQKLEQYTEALLDHIAVENEEVFVSAESLFEEKDLQLIKFHFDDCDRELGEDKKAELQNQIELLRKQLFVS